MSVDGNLAAIGTVNGGAAYIFDTSTGQQNQKLTTNDGNLLTHSIDISGTTAVAGASTSNDRGLRSGTAYIFDATTGSQSHKLTAHDTVQGDEFGIAVAISEDIVVVGAARDDDNGIDSGSATLFDATTGNQLRKLTALDGAAQDLFGSAVDIDGDKVVIGAWHNQSAYIFDATTGTQLQQLTAQDTGIGVCLPSLSLSTITGL